MFKDRRHGEQLRLFIFIRMASTEAFAYGPQRHQFKKKKKKSHVSKSSVSTGKKKKPGG